MGLFDRLLGSRGSSVKVSGAKPDDKAAGKPSEAFFLDPDSSTTLGDVNFMRRSNTIRHTFPGNADNPGEKELVQEVGSMQARVEAVSPGLGGASTAAGGEVSLTGGVPNKPKKTFAQQMSPAELAQRLKGSAVKGVNDPAAKAGPARKAEGEADQPAITQKAAKPGSPEAFKALAKDFNA